MSSTPPSLPLPENMPEESLPPIATAAPVLPYASPIGYGSGPQVWREGNALIVHKYATFSDRCIKCGSTENVTPLRRTLYWHNPALYILILFPGLLIYAI